jgi:exonuclease SbcC
MDERQEQYERQLYQLSQRLTLQNQLNEQEAQERQYQQQLTATRQALENTLLALSLNVPEEGHEAAWLHAREAEFAQWQEKQTQHGVLQERINALKPLLDTLPETNGEEAEPAIPDNWRDIHDECVSLQSQLTAQQQQSWSKSACSSRRRSSPRRSQRAALPIGTRFLPPCWMTTLFVASNS